MSIYLAILSIIIGMSLFIDHIIIDQKISNKIKNSIIDIWINLTEFSLTNAIINVREKLNLLFDNIFTKKHLSFKCFLRSILASSIAIIISILIMPTYHKWLRNAPEYYSNFENKYLFALDNYFDYVLSSLPFFILLLVQNFFIDYLSLIETRYILKIKTNKIITIIGILILDFILTFLILVIPLYIEYVVLGNRDFWQDFIGMINTHMHGTKVIMYPFLISTFFTSIIFYIFIITTITFKILSILRIPTKGLLELLANSSRPTTYFLGILSAILLSLKGIEKIYIYFIN